MLTFIYYESNRVLESRTNRNVARQQSFEFHSGKTLDETLVSIQDFRKCIIYAMSTPLTKVIESNRIIEMIVFI